MRWLRNQDPHPTGGRTVFFVPRSSLVSDAFFLAYGGLHWGWSETRSLPLRVRRQFVEALERQLDFEREQTERR
ncbi:MAG: hypothetical protein Tsb0017_28370 [Geothermobacteraceae bacterium]